MGIATNFYQALLGHLIEGVAKKLNTFKNSNTFQKHLAQKAAKMNESVAQSHTLRVVEASAHEPLALSPEWLRKTG